MTRRLLYALFLAAVLSAVTVSATVNPPRPLYRDSKNVLALRGGTPTTWRVYSTYSEQERITLSSPETVPNNLTYRVERIVLQSDDPGTASVDEGLIHIQLAGVERPVPVSCVYSATTNPTATTLLNALNKANLSSTYNNNATTGSLVQRIFHRLFSGGLNEGPAICGRALTGTLTGSPQ